MYRIGARGSQLALAQASMVRSAMGGGIEIISIKTSGDITRGNLAHVGGKGLFIKELEQALFDRRIDIAVHSMKDVPAFYHRDLQILPLLKRGTPNDAFVSFYHKKISELSDNARIGTCSVRRSMQMGDEFKIIPIRGNIETRIEKAKNLDGILLSFCALERLNIPDEVAEVIPIETMLPAVGQGTLAAQFRRDDSLIADALSQIVDWETSICTDSERAFLERVNGDCLTPLAAFAILVDGNIHLRAMLAGKNGVFFTSRIGSPGDARLIGNSAADELLRRCG